MHAYLHDFFFNFNGRKLIKEVAEILIDPLVHIFCKQMSKH